MNKPLVSLLIPSFNSAKYLQLAVESALDQTYENLEIIVHDDASTDETPEILKKYSSLPKVRLIRTSKNHGMLSGWNYLVKQAKGEYLKFLASDDLLTPTCVEELVSAARINSQAAIICCKRQFIDDQGTTIKTVGFSHKNQLVDGRAYAHEVLTTIRENKIGEPTAVLYPAKLVSQAGGYDSAFSQFGDFEYWLRLLEFGDLVYVHKTLCSFRTHSASNTTKAILDGRFIDEIFLLIDKYYSSAHFQRVFSLSEKEKSAVMRQKTLDTLKNIKDLFVAGKLRQAKNYFTRLMKHVELDYLTKSTLSHILK